MLAAANKPGPYGELLVDPVMKKKFDELSQLVQRNHMNDVNYLTHRVAEIAKAKLPILLRLSTIYTEMLQKVPDVRPEITTASDSFKFLADDTNLLAFFMHQVTQDGKSTKDFLTGKESPATAEHLAEMTHAIKLRESRLRFYQFKFAQSTLFHVAFSSAIWDVSQMFVTTTEAFHKTRENAFNSVYNKLMNIINEYVGREQLKPKDIQEMDDIKALVDDTAHLMAVRKSLETSKTTNLKALLAQLAQLEPSFVTGSSAVSTAAQQNPHKPVVAALVPRSSDDARIDMARRLIKGLPDALKPVGDDDKQAIKEYLLKKMPVPLPDTDAGLAALEFKLKGDLESKRKYTIKKATATGLSQAQVLKQLALLQQPKQKATYSNNPFAAFLGQ